jgi:hypothetical protein
LRAGINKNDFRDESIVQFDPAPMEKLAKLDNKVLTAAISNLPKSSWKIISNTLNGDCFFLYALSEVMAIALISSYQSNGNSMMIYIFFFITKVVHHQNVFWFL